MKPKYRIVRVSFFRHHFNVEKRFLFLWRTVAKGLCSEDAHKYCENAINPVVKEY